MHNLLLIVLIIVLIYLIGKSTMVDYDIPRNSDPVYFNMNIRDICKSVDNHTDDKDSKEDVKLTECEKRVKSQCPPEKSVEDQLFEEKKKYNELKLKFDNKTPPYSFYKDDRYIVLPDEDLTYDDKLTKKMIDVGCRAKEALDSRAMFDKNSLLPYLEEELQMHANSVWWDDDALEQVF